MKTGARGWQSSRVSAKYIDLRDIGERRVRPRIPPVPGFRHIALGQRQEYESQLILKLQS